MLFGIAATGTGNGLANSITGNAIGNTLSGLAGSDILIGGAGPDILIGGLDNDTFVSMRCPIHRSARPTASGRAAARSHSRGSVAPPATASTSP